MMSSELRGDVTKFKDVGKIIILQERGGGLILGINFTDIIFEWFLRRLKEDCYSCFKDCKVESRNCMSLSSKLSSSLQIIPLSQTQPSLK